MALFQWVPFLTRHRLPHNTRGPNTPHGAVTIHCPMCAEADPSDHMVLWPSGGWRCWRDYKHGGRHPQQLVQLLIGCSYTEAQRITSSVVMPTNDQLANVNMATMFGKPAAPVVRDLTMPPEFRPLSHAWACKPYVKYLRNRGFVEDPTLLHYSYGLHYATRGVFQGRVLLPVFYKGKLISWTGRTIWPAELVRYKTLTTDPDRAAALDLEPALAPINHFLPWYDWLREEAHEEGRELVLVEGPLDALKINLLGHGRPHIVSTCWMGSEPTRQQVDLLHGIAGDFYKRWIISDADMPEKAYRIANRLLPVRFNVAELPRGVKDPAELRTRAQLLGILR